MNMLKRIRHRRLLKSACAKLDRREELLKGMTDEEMMSMERHLDPKTTLTRDEERAMSDMLRNDGLLEEAAMIDRVTELKHLALSSDPVTADDAEEAVALATAFFNRMEDRMRA